MLAPIKRALLIVAGTLSLLSGIVGLFLPIIPTVPFVILAAFCFADSSERLHSWLLGNRHFGSIIRNFELGRGIPRQIKFRAIALLWLSMGISSWIIGKPLLYLMLPAIGIGVSLYLYRMPEYKLDEDEPDKIEKASRDRQSGSAD